MKHNSFNVQDEFKDLTSSGHKANQSKYEYDLYDEVKAAEVSDVIQVKRVSLPNKGMNWKIIKNNKVIFVLEGIKLGKKEKEYLLTADGFNFLIKQTKIGFKSFNALRSELKINMKNDKNWTSTA